VAVLFGVLEEDHIVLDEGVVDHIVNVKFEMPGHGHFLLAGEVDEVGYNFVDI
jgi:hypothetical protein